MWIVSLAEKVLEVYRTPVLRGDGTAAYRMRTDYYAGDRVTPSAFPALELAVRDILLSGSQ